MEVYIPQRHYEEYTVIISACSSYEKAVDSLIRYILDNHELTPKIAAEVKKEFLERPNVINDTGWIDSFSIEEYTLE